MIDTRTTEERIRARLAAEREAKQAIEDEKYNRELAVRDNEAKAKQLVAEAEKLKSEAQNKALDITKMYEENKNIALKLQSDVAKEEYYYQKNRREQLDRLSDTNWIEEQRHFRRLDIEEIKLKMAVLETEAKKFESMEAANEIRALLSSVETLTRK